MNTEIDTRSKKISNNELKHFYGIEDVFTVLQKELVNAKHGLRLGGGGRGYFPPLNFLV
jgi:hypothetical protein